MELLSRLGAGAEDALGEDGEDGGGRNISVLCGSTGDGGAAVAAGTCPSLSNIWAAFCRGVRCCCCARPCCPPSPSSAAAGSAPGPPAPRLGWRARRGVSSCPSPSGCCDCDCGCSSPSPRYLAGVWRGRPLRLGGAPGAAITSTTSTVTDSHYTVIIIVIISTIVTIVMKVEGFNV